MDSRTSQQSSGGYVVVNQEDLHHTYMPQPADKADSVSSIDQGDNSADELARTALDTSASSHKEPQIDVEQSPAIPLPKDEWRSWKHSWWFNTAALLTEIAFIVAIAVLDRLSARNNGIITVPNVESSSSILNLFVIPKIRQYYGLLWTSLPSLIFTLYSLAWATVVAASYERQPFIELRRGGDALRTIMLDYRAYPAFYNWILAFMHDHIHIGCAMFLGLIVSIVVVPLSAHLFVAAASTHQSSVSLDFATQYNDSLVIASTNLQPFIDIATAVHAYGSTPPAWMTTEYAFAPFSITATNSSSGSFANLTATTDAYSAYLDCHVFESGSYTVSYEDKGIEGGNDLGTVTAKLSDRSCSIQLEFGLSSNTPTYAQSWWATCEGQTTNRFGMLVGTYSPSSLSKLIDFSVVSCIPSYWHTTGILTVSLNDASPLTSNYIAFTTSASASMQPAFSETFERVLHEYTIFNAAAATNADALGFSILSAATTAASRDAKAAMAPDGIKNATERVFTTVYAALTKSELLTPAENTTGGNGILTKPVNRLFVTRPIAYTIVAVLVLVLASHMALWIYAVRNKSVLGEEPVGLLGNAVLLERGDVGMVVRRVRAKYGEDGKVKEGLEKGFDVKGAKCIWDEHEGRIRVEGLAEK